jgi:hypothetical protein
MRIRAARAAAVDWVMRHGRADPGYRGAFFAGSTTWRSGGEELPLDSDVDVAVVSAADPPPAKLGKFEHHGVLLEVTHLDVAELATAERVLGSFYLAGSFRVDTVIDDPTGHLGRIRDRVSRDFAERMWVRQRCAHARGRIEGALGGLEPAAPFADQVTGWLFGTSLPTQVLLVAALRNPTVRLRYLAARAVLVDYGQPEVYQELLELLGVDRLSRQQVQHQLVELARTFDATVAVARSPFFFSGDITAAARHVAIDGSARLIDGGWHREAVFWIIATFARCHQILAVDAPELLRAHRPAFESAVADLGIGSIADLHRRAADALAFLPRLDRTTETILTTNPGITAR